MTPEIAQMALQFMERVGLQAPEIPAFQEVLKELRAEIYKTQEEMEDDDTET